MTTPCRVSEDLKRYLEDQEKKEMSYVATDKETIIRRRTEELAADSILEMDDAFVNAICDSTSIRDLVSFKVHNEKDLSWKEVQQLTTLALKVINEVVNREMVYQKKLAEEEYLNGDLGE